MIHNLLTLGIRAEILQLTFVAGAICGMLVEAAMIVAFLTGHDLAGWLR